jgi:hypothetical protein
VTLWAGHRGDPHGTRPDPGLLELTVDDTLGAAYRVLAAASPPPPARVARRGQLPDGTSPAGMA